MSANLQHFSVQTIGPDGRPIEASCIPIDATNPIHAAELVLGTVLAIHGKAEQAKAIVWRLDDDFRPVSTILYVPA